MTSRQSGASFQQQSRFGLTLATFAVLLASCGSPAATAVAPPVPPEDEQKAVLDGSSNCPVTRPRTFVPEPPAKVTYSKAFPAPDPFPSEYPHEGSAWYGTDELWTVLPIDGEYPPRKSVWWSSLFPGGMAEAWPEVWVTWTRLDIEDPLVVDNEGKATNAFIHEQGWFMIAGMDPNEPGCWKVEATYKGNSLSYVYEKR